MWTVKSDTFVEELSRMRVIKLIEDGESHQAAQLCYQIVLKEALPTERRQKGDNPNLYDMLSYLIDKAAILGFTLESKIDNDSIVFAITNNRMQESRVIPILLELLLAHIFEKLSDMKSEITRSGKETIVKIRLR
jgi:hypothetical protein